MVELLQDEGDNILMVDGAGVFNGTGPIVGVQLERLLFALNVGGLEEAVEDVRHPLEGARVFSEFWVDGGVLER